ncbi:MAG: DNA polymerase III subunit chi [Pseudomonadota bacterium]
MVEVYFYHLTQQPLDATLRVLLEKSRAAGWRVVVRGRSEETLARLDEQLWLRPEDGFLPHGRAGGDYDAEQPILLTKEVEVVGPFEALVSIEGAEIIADEVRDLARAMILFDGHEAGDVERARAQWRVLTAAGLPAKYWSEETGKWQMKAESS